MDDPQTLLDDDFTTIRRGPSRAPWVFLLLAILGAGAAIFLWLRLQAARADAETARAEQAELAQRLERMEAEKADLLALRNELSLQVQAKEDEIQKLQGTFQELEAKMKEEIAKGDVRLSQSGGRIKVDLVDKILFDVGDAGVTERGAGVLSRLGAVLAAVEDKKIQVSGHTDDLPISDRLRDRYPTNWELSTDRATGVLRYLAAKLPVARMSATGFADTRPLKPGTSNAALTANRRVEIVVLASVDNTAGRAVAEVANESTDGAAAEESTHATTTPTPTPSASATEDAAADHAASPSAGASEEAASGH
jgi:chemotaxis protein MotB